VILDQAMDHFDALTRRNFQTVLLELEMEQIIVIDAVNQEYQDNPQYKIIRVECGELESTIIDPSDREKKIDVKTIVSSANRVIDLRVEPKNNLDYVAGQIKVQIKKVDAEIAQFSLRMNEMIAIRAQYYAKKDLVRANVYGGRIAERGAIIKLAVQAKLSLEKTQNLFYIANTEAKSAETLVTAVELVRKVRGMIHCILPTIEHDLGNIESLLNEIVKDIFKENRIEENNYPVREQVDTILKKALNDAELEVKEKFPTQFHGLSHSGENKC
jgi:hypothetical protein